MRRTLLCLIGTAGALSVDACSDDRPLSSLPGANGGTGGKKDAGKDASEDGASGSAGSSTGGVAGGAAGSGGVAGADASIEDAPSDVSYDAYPVDGSACGAVIANHPIDPSPHVDLCTHIDYSTNPPSSGPHYPIWASYTVYSTPIPCGFWVHCLEHGAVVFSYNCPSGCAAEIAAAKAMIAALPSDPLCGEVAPLRRVVLVPDPLLDVKWAASAWGWTLKASCFEDATFSQFYLDHFGQGTEATCFDGQLINGDGGFGVPANCGEVGFDAGLSDAGGD